MTEIATLEFKAKTGDLDKADKKLNDIEKSGKKVEASNKKMASSFGQMSKIGKQRLTQVGLQTQDVVVQLEGGVAASRTLAQQLPQLLGFFGPLGAAAGVAAAALSITFSKWIDRTYKTMIATENLASALKSVQMRAAITADGVVEYTDRIKELAKVSKEAAGLEIAIAISQSQIAIKKATKDMKKEIESISKPIKNWAKEVDRFGTTGLRARENINKLAKELKVTSEEIVQFAAVSEKALKDPTIENTKRFYELGSAIGIGSKKMRAFYTTLGSNLTQISESTRLMKALEGASKDVIASISKDEIDAIAEAEAKLEAHFNKKQTLRELDHERQLEVWRKTLDAQTREDEKRAQAETGARARIDAHFSSYNDRLNIAHERRIQIIKDANLSEERENQLSIKSSEMLMNQKLAYMSGHFGNMASIFQSAYGEQNAITKAAFITQRALAIPQMITATEQGATMALSLGPVAGPIAAALVKGLGYASIGTVMGQTLAGRAQGGQVRPGESYRVGEYGPETLVMGASGGRVIPGGAQNDPVNFNLETNVKVIGGSSQAKVTNEMSKVNDRKWVQSIVVDMMNDKTSGAMQGVFKNTNAQPRGSR